MRIAPGGPFNQEKGLNPIVKANLERQYNLDQPLWKQYLQYLNDLVHGDLGPSYVLPDFTVAELFRAGLPISIQLGASALILALLVGGTLGVIAALKQNQSSDYSVIALATAGSTIPTFVIAPLLQLTFGLALAWLPVGGWGGGGLSHKILPIVTLALPQMAIVARLMRGSMIEVMQANFIRTARAKGLSPLRVIFVHALKPAFLPVLSYLGPATAGIITGSVVIEQIFGLPGIGRYFVQAALNRDYTLVLGVVLFYGALIILLNLIVDVLYTVLDPRVRA